MESYNQPWTVVNKYEQYQSEPKTYEYYVNGKKPEYECAYYKPEGHHYKGEKPEYYVNGKKPEYECAYYKPEGLHYKGEKSEGYCKPEYYYKGEKPEGYYKPEGLHYKGEKPEGCCKPEYYYKGEKPEGYCKPEYYYKGEKPEGSKWERLDHGTEEYSKYYKGEKPEYYSKTEQYYKGEKPEWCKKVESITGEWEKVVDSMERWQLERPTCEGRFEIESKPHWRCAGKKCCDEEMVKLVQGMINILIGAEQSYIQLGFLCMDEKFTLVNTSEYFRLCGLRMRWLANGLIAKSVRLFNVYDWINNTTFENWFKVPTKDELATNDYTTVIKTFFKIAMDAETRIVEHMNILGEKMIKADWVNTECRFEGFKWFVNFVLPYQTKFVREMAGHFRNIEMCDNGFIFDKCEMYPLVQKVEEFIHQITKLNTTGSPIWAKNGIIPIKKW